MRRVLLTLMACVVTLAVAWYFAGLPGHVTAEIGATTIEMATPVAALGLLLAFILLYLLFRLLGGVAAAAPHRRALGRRARPPPRRPSRHPRPAGSRGG